MNIKKKPSKHIRLTSHPDQKGASEHEIHWGASTAKERGPIIASTTHPQNRNVIGSHSGSYAVYRALSVAAGNLDPNHVPDLTNTNPAESIGPHKQWFDKSAIVSIDPWGHSVIQDFSDLIEKGYDIRPSIAVTKAQIKLPEIDNAILDGRLKPDGTILKENGNALVTKIAIEPVWYLPGVAERFGVDETELRRVLFEQTGGMYSELVTRPDLNVFLPPIGGITAYVFGDIKKIGDPNTKLACRVHDECNGSDVFGSDICTCRPYLVYGIEVCVQAAQEGGVGLLVYFRKEGRALGEVTKFLVYNARKRQSGGDRAEAYFERTECVAGVQDARFQELMPDIFSWLGIQKIDQFVSMSNMKHDSITRHGIDIKERISIPEEMVPDDAQVEIDAKIAAGYYSEKDISEEELKKAKGRDLDQDE